MLACRLGCSENSSQQGVDLLLQIVALHAAQGADQLQIFPAGQIGIKMSLFGDVAEEFAVGGQVLLNIVAVETNDAARGLKQSGEHLYCCALAGTIWARDIRALARDAG